MHACMERERQEKNKTFQGGQAAPPVAANTSSLLIASPHSGHEQASMPRPPAAAMHREIHAWKHPAHVAGSCQQFWVMRRDMNSIVGLAVLHRMHVRSRAGVLRREAGVPRRGASAVGGREEPE